MTKTLKFDEALWKARTEGSMAWADVEYREQPTPKNPYLATSSCAMAWLAGFAFGSDRITSARGAAVNVQIGTTIQRMTWEELVEAAKTPRHASVKVSYLHGMEAR